MTNTTTRPAKSGISSLWWASRNPPEDPKASYTGKTVLITCANVGLGLEAAIKFASLGAAKLILGVRCLENGKAVKAQIEEKIGRRDTEWIYVLELDMGSFDSIEGFSDRVSAQFPRIDIAVLNAGIGPSPYDLSPEEWEMCLQVNVISTAYLAILLLPKLRKTGSDEGEPAHLEFVGSMHQMDVEAISIKSANLGGPGNNGKKEKKLNFSDQYAQTKLLVMWIMNQIASKTSPSQVVVNGCCPGLCRSSLKKDFRAFLKISNYLSQRALTRSSEEGSRTIVSVTGLGVEGHGGFWTNDKLAQPGLLMTSEEGKGLEKQFWEETMDVLRQRNPDIEARLNGSL